MEVSSIGSFEIIGSLGSGPRGIVYRARHLTLGRVVAIKQLTATVSADSPEFSRLQNEVERLRAVASNDVLVPLSVDVVDGRPLIEMELLGDSLEKGLRQGPLPLPEALGVLHSVLSGLKTLHTAGIVHANLKPSNVLQDTASSGWKVADGGMTPIESQTSPTLLATSVLYLAPESISRAPDARSDLYSAGMVGLEAILGAEMFDAFPGPTRSRAPSRWLAWLEDGTEARPLRELRPEIHDRISQFFSRLLSKQPEIRQLSAEAALSELEEILPLAEAAPLQSSLGDSVTEIRPAYPTATIAAIPQLLVKGPSGFERKIDLVDQRTYRIGRDSLNDIVLPDEAKAISRMHAELGCDQGRFVIKDLESQNGISVGGRKTPTAELTPGTTVKIGAYTLSLLMPAASMAASVAKPGPKTKTNAKTTSKTAVASAWWPPKSTAQWASFAAVAVVVLAVGTWAAWPKGPSQAELDRLQQEELQEQQQRRLAEQEEKDRLAREERQRQEQKAADERRKTLDDANAFLKSKQWQQAIDAVGPLLQVNEKDEEALKIKTDAEAALQAEAKNKKTTPGQKPQAGVVIPPSGPSPLVQRLNALFEEASRATDPLVALGHLVEIQNLDSMFRQGEVRDLVTSRRRQAIDRILEEARQKESSKDLLAARAVYQKVPAILSDSLELRSAGVALADRLRDVGEKALADAKRRDGLATQRGNATMLSEAIQLYERAYQYLPVGHVGRTEAEEALKRLKK